MSNRTLPGGIDRHTFFKTRHRGFAYRFLADGSKVFWGYVPGKGRTRIQARGERDALAEWRDLCGKAAKGEKIPPANVRFRDIAEDWYESTYRLRLWTRKLYRAALDNEVLPRFGHLKLGQIDAEMIARFIRKLDERGLATSTVYNYCLPLAGTLDLAVRRGLLTVNPYRLLTRADMPAKRERKKAYEWTDEETHALLSASERLARQPSAQQDYTPLLRVAVETGLRLGELLGLKWGDIDLDEGVLNVRRQFTRTGELAEPKTEKALRRVPLPTDTVTFLRRNKLASKFSQPDDFVFSSRAGTPLLHRNVQRRGFEPARDLAGLPDTLTFHDLRHAFVSRAASRGVPLEFVAEIVGHTSTSHTEVYRHIYDRPAAEQAFRQAMGRA